jgi:hypothetical protein
MGYLSSAVGKPLKWIGGAAAVYGGYKLATQNSGEVTESVTGAMDALEEDSDGLEAAATLLESTGEQMDANPEYGANLGTAGKGLAAAAIGAYLDGSLSAEDLDY